MQPESEAFRDAIINTKEILFVAAAGNSGFDLGNLDNQFISYPSHYQSDNLIVVAGYRADGSLYSNSNYGGSVQIAAPGEAMLTTNAGGSAGFTDIYSTATGTSFSAPYVSGVAALIWGRYPELSAMSVKDRIIDNARHNSKIDGKVINGNTIDALAAVCNSPEWNAEPENVLSVPSVTKAEKVNRIRTVQKNTDDKYKTNQVIVSFSDSAMKERFQNYTYQDIPDYKVLTELNLINALVLQLDTVSDAENVVEWLNNLEAVNYAELNYKSIS